MRSDGKRITAALMLSIWFLTPLKARAAEMEEISLACPEDQWAHITPFTVTHTVLKPEGEIYFSGTCAPRLAALSYGEEQAPAYSVDPAAGAAEGHRYLCRNLEDSGAFSDETAGKLRAILREAYPWQTVETLQERANAWLRARELPEVRELQSGEAILSAQIAIWKLTGGGAYKVHSLYSGVMDLRAYENQVGDREGLDQAATEYTPGNIESLYTYFYNLEPAKAEHILVSDSSVTRTRYSGREENGTYTLEVAVTIDAAIGEEDSLILTAACGGEVQTQTLPGPGEYRFAFPGCPERLPVELEIRGVQWGRDVCLFECAEDGAAPQSLAGYWEGYLPISWKRVLEPSPVPLWD